MRKAEFCPKEEKKKKCLVNAISRSDHNLIAQHPHVCSDHFIVGKNFCFTKVCSYVSSFKLKHIKGSSSYIRVYTNF